MLVEEEKQGACTVFRGCPVHRRRVRINASSTSSSPPLRPTIIRPSRYNVNPDPNERDLPSMPVPSEQSTRAMQRPRPTTTQCTRCPATTPLEFHLSSLLLTDANAIIHNVPGVYTASPGNHWKMLHQFPLHLLQVPSSIVGFSQNETSRGRTTSTSMMIAGIIASYDELDTNS